MSLPVVLIADKLAESTVAALGDQVEVRWVDGPDREKLLAAVPEADALLVRSATTVDAEVLAAAPKLKIVARAGVGLDNVDVDAATARGVLVVNAPTSNIHSAAEHALALMLAAARQVTAADASLREHTWKRSSFSGTEIFGKTVGVVGLGRIGQLVAQRLAAFGTHVVAYDPYVSSVRAAQLGIELLTLDELLARADFISVHLPKTPETAGLIGKEALAKTKPGVIIVNAARGGLVDEEALAEAVSSGHVRAAGIDVFASEPTTDSPLFDLPQVVVTPHLGASTAEAQDRAGTDVAESVKLALAGEFVPDAVNVGGGVVGEEVAPWLDLVRKLGLVIGVLSAELPVSISVQSAQAYARLRHDFGPTVLRHIPGEDIVNLQSVDGLPLVLAGLAAFLGAAAVGNTLAIFVRRRRRDLAILKTLGFRRRQVAATVAWQVTSFMLAALALGLPLGVAAGRWAWDLAAVQLESAAPPAVPALAIALVVPAALLAGNVLAAMPARTAARTAPAISLRQE